MIRGWEDEGGIKGIEVSEITRDILVAEDWWEDEERR